MEFLKGYQVRSELMDDDYIYILSEYNLNFSTEALRASYWKEKEKERNKVDNETLRMLGYSEESIKNRIR